MESLTKRGEEGTVQCFRVLVQVQLSEHLSLPTAAYGIKYQRK